MHRHTPVTDFDVAVVGGGYAGLTAAIDTTDAGLRAVVFEAAPELGGRARRVGSGGIARDNGQHILLGAYRELLARIDRCWSGAQPPYRRHPLTWIAPGMSLRAWRLPGPLGLAMGLLAARGLGWSERVAALRFVARWHRRGFRTEAADWTVTRLIATEPARLRALLWEPLCVAALNTAPDDASAQQFLAVLGATLAAGSGGSDLILPTTDFTALYPAGAAARIAAGGGEVAAGERVRSLAADGGTLCIVTARRELRVRAVIVAVAPYALEALLGEWEGAHRGVAEALVRVRALVHEPIVTVYLSYERPPSLPFPMIQLAGEPGQWLFDRDALVGARGECAVVVSAAGALAGLAREEIAERIGAQVATSFPQAGPVTGSYVVTDRRATYRAAPGLARPGGGMIAPGVFLAGDYTHPVLPATLEAAVQSGAEAAAAVRAWLARPR